MLAADRSDRLHRVPAHSRVRRLASHPPQGGESRRRRRALAAKTLRSEERDSGEGIFDGSNQLLQRRRSKRFESHHDVRSNERGAMPKRRLESRERGRRCWPDRA